MKILQQDIILKNIIIIITKIFVNTVGKTECITLRRVNRYNVL